MSFLRACTTRRRAAPRRQLLRRRPRVRESGPREDVARPCNAIDAAVLVVPWPAPSLSTHEHHCKSAAPGAASVRKEPLVVLSRAIDLSHFAGRAAPGPRAGRPSPALHRMERRLFCLVRDVSASPKAACSRQRIARSPPPAALPDAAQRWRGAAAPLQQLLRRGAARRRARAHSEDGWTTVATLSAACGAAGPRAAGARSPGPGRAIGRAARKKTRRVLVRGRGSTMNRHTHTAHARNEGRGRRTHTTNTLRARRDGRHERSIRHTHPIQKCDRVPSEYAEPGLRRGRRHNLQIDGTARPSYGGRWLLRRAFSRSTRWLMWSWTTCFV